MSISAIKVSEFGKYKRIDAEYYQPHLLNAEEQLDKMGWEVSPLGDLVKEGYRVVYENTYIADEPFDPTIHAKFLQAADISSSFPVINYDSIGWVGIEDWLRYPKGRIRRGEILVEVKGKAEKVALVPDDFPEDSLVTGTLYKMLVDKEKVSPEYVLVYLLSKFGCNFRDRTKTNTLISYVSKEELYDIPVPIAPRPIQNAIVAKYQQSYRQYRQAQELYIEAERLLAAELGLDRLDLSESLFNVRRVSEVLNSSRMDAEYFKPKYERVLELMRRSGKTIGDVAPLAKRRFEPQPEKPFNYIEISDLSGDGHTESSVIAGEEAPSRAQWIVRNNDIITSTVRPIRRLSAIIEPEQEGFVCSSGFAVLQPKLIKPEVLLLYLRLPVFCEIMDLYTTASMYPAISTDELLNLPIPMLKSERVAEQLAEKVRASRQARQDAKRLLAEAKREVEVLIEGA